MSVIDLDTKSLRDATLRMRIDRLLSSLGQGFNAYIEREGRLHEIRRLNAMSDAELSRLGVTRDRIPHHVFRDLMGF
jgi:uncharacterized protein YjiS (DUF1127 family)